MRKARSDLYTFPWNGAKKALVALEDFHAQGYLTEALTRAGYTTILCNPPRTLLEGASLTPCSFIILQGGVAGVEILRTLRTQGNEIPAILLSGETTRSPAPMDGNLGPMGRLSAPFTLATLTTVISKVCHLEPEASLAASPPSPSGDTTLGSSESPEADRSK